MIPALVAATCAAISALSACGSQIQTSIPPGTELPANYPFTVVESPEHREAMRLEWARLFDACGVPPERRRVPELTPVLHTPQSILGIGPIRLSQTATGRIGDSEIRELLRRFMTEYAQILGVAPSAVSLEDARFVGGLGTRYTFVQTGYEYDIMPPAGRLEFLVSPAGEIVQMSVSTIPSVELPTEARISRSAAGERVLGTTFPYGDKAGRPQTVTITDPRAVTVTRLVVFPEATESAVSIRLCWEVQAGEGLAWTVFVDAITGQIVGTRQNFQT